MENKIDSEDTPIKKQSSVDFYEQTPVISNPWPTEAYERVNQLVEKIAAEQAECQRLRDALTFIANVNAMDYEYQSVARECLCQNAKRA